MFCPSILAPMVCSATIVEAAALGFPSVVSEETNIGDFITAFDAGPVYESLDAQAFYQSLRQRLQKEYTSTTNWNNSKKCIAK